MATTITAGGVSAPTPQDISPDASLDSMASNSNPFEQELYRPAVEAEQERAKELKQWRKDTIRSAESNLLDFDKFQPNESEPVRQQRLIRAIMDAEHDVQPKSSANYQVARARISKQMFGEPLDDGAFFSKLQERAQTRKDRKDFENNLRYDALNSMVTWMVPEMAGNKTRTGYDGRSDEKDRKVYNDAQNKAREKYGDIIPQVQRMYKALVDGDSQEVATRAFYELDDEDRLPALALLKTTALANPNEETHLEGVSLFIYNFGKSEQGAFDSVIDSTINGVKWYTGAMASSPVAGGGNESLRGQAMMERDESLFRDQVKRIAQSDFDPMKYLFPEGETVLGSVERGLYAAPEAVGTSVMAALPAVGTLGVFMSMEQRRSSEYYDRLIKGGMGHKEAAGASSEMGFKAAVVDSVLEKVGISFAVGKSAGAKAVFDKIGDKVTNKLLRRSLTAGASIAAETGTELAQDASAELIQDIGHALQEEIPDIQWTGEGGVFDGYAYKILETAVAVAPISAATTLSNDKDAQSRIIARASKLERMAAGMSEEHSDAIDSAEGASSLNTAVANGLGDLNPNSESAKKSTVELNREISKQKKLVEKAQEIGALPSIRVRSGTNEREVYDNESGEVIGVAESDAEAVNIAFQHKGIQDRVSQDTLDYYVSQVEGATLDALESDGDSVTEVKLDQQLDTDSPEVMAQQSQQERERTQAQLDLLGLDRGVFFGSNRDLWEGDQRTVLTQLNKGATILTQVHERGHAYYRRALEAGNLTHESTWDFFQQVDAAMAGAKTKDGKDLSFLKGRTEMTVEAVDEAVAEFQEVMLLRTRNGKKSKMRELLNKNLTAFVKANVPGSKTLKALVDGMRKFFEVALGRHVHIKKAIREGRLTEDQIEEFRAKLQGTTAQEQYESDVRDEFAEIIRDDIDYDDVVDENTMDVPFSIGAAQDAEYMSAVESGDMETAQAMVDEAAKAAGYDSPKVFHGTAADFDVFDKDQGGDATNAESAEIAFFFTNDERTANAYAAYAAVDVPVDKLVREAEAAADRNNWDLYDELTIKSEAMADYEAGFKRKTENSRVVSAYLKGDFHTLDAEGETPQGLHGSGGDLDAGISGALYEAMDEDYEGVLFRNLDDAVGLSNAVADHYAVFEPNQIKSAEPVTHDTEGNVIPLSERFNEAKDSISYSLGKPVAEVTSNEFPKVEGLSARERVYEYLETHDELSAKHPKLGEIKVTKGGIKSSFSKGLGKVKLSSFKALHSLLEKGEVIDEQVNWKGRGYGTAVLAAPVSVDGKEHLMIAVVEKKSANKYYLHETLSVQKNTDGSFQIPILPNKGRAVEPSDIYGVAQKYLDSKKDGGHSFSIGHADALDQLADSPVFKAAKPQAKVSFFDKIVARLMELKKEPGDIVQAFGKEFERDGVVDPRSKKSLTKEASMRFALLTEEYTLEANADLEQFDESNITKLRSQPVHEYLSDPHSNLKGSLISKAELKRQGRLEKVFAEFDGSEGIARGLYGGTLTPDQAAQELYQEGLIKSPFPDAMWEALDKEKNSVAINKDSQAKSKENLKAAKEKAKAESDQWLEDELAKQKRDNNPVARIRRSLKTLDAIVMALPSELRGKVGGHSTLANLSTDQARLDYLKGRIEKVDKILDKWIADETRKMIDKTFKKAAIKKNTKGIPKAKLAADFTDEIREIESLSKMSKQEVEDRTDELIKEIEQLEQEPESEEQVERLTDELVKVMAFGDMKNQGAEQSIEAFKNIQRVFDSGLMLREAYEAEFKAEVDHLKEVVNHDVTGGKEQLDEQAAKRRAANNKRLAGLSKFHRQNISFEWLLNGLARENKEVGTLESKTHKVLASMVHKSTHAEKRDNMATEARYNQAMSDVFGVKRGLKLSKEIVKLTEETDTTGVMKTEYGAHGAVSKGQARASNIRSIMDGKAERDALGLSKAEYKAAVARYREMQKKAPDGVVKDNAWVHYEYANQGKEVEMRLSQDQAINLSMLWMQPDLRESMEREGFTAETMDQLESFLTDEAKQVRDFLRKEYDSNYDALNVVFKKIMGVNLPKHEFYSPAVRKAQGNVKEMAIDSHGGSAMTTSPNFLISRVKNFAQVDQTVGALSIFARHTAQSNHYIHWAESIKKLRSVFGDVQVKKNVKDYAGESMLSVLNERVEWMADGGNRKASHLLWLDKMRTAFTYSALAYNLFVAAKQLTSIPAYAFDMSLKDFGKYSAKFMRHPIKNMKFIWNLDYTQARFKEGYERDVIEGLRGDGAAVQRMLQTGMMFGKIGDIVPVMSGGWMAYQKAYDQAKVDGAKDAQAHEIGVMQFEQSTDRAQQAGDLKDLSSFQAGGSIFKLFTMFKTSPRQYYANVYESFLDAKAGKKGAKQEFARRFLIGQFVLPLTFQFVSDLLRSGLNDEDEEDYSPQDYVRAMLLGPLNGLFIAGDALELISSGVADTKIWSEKVPILDPIEKAAHGIQDLWDGDFAEGVDNIARGAGKAIPSALTFYEIIRREIDRFKLLDED